MITESLKFVMRTTASESRAEDRLPAPIRTGPGKHRKALLWWGTRNQQEQQVAAECGRQYPASYFLWRCFLNVFNSCCVQRLEEFIFQKQFAVKAKPPSPGQEQWRSFATSSRGKMISRSLRPTSMNKSCSDALEVWSPCDLGTEFWWVLPSCEISKICEYANMIERNKLSKRQEMDLFHGFIQSVFLARCAHAFWCECFSCNIFEVSSMLPKSLALKGVVTYLYFFVISLALSFSGCEGWTRRGHVAI